MRTLISAVLLCFLSTIAHAAGIKPIEIPADAAGPALKGMVWTPCAAVSEPLQVGAFVLAGRRNCPTVGEKLPLVVISHGHGGSDLGHHDLAEALADAGFVVAAIDHPGDTFSDMSRAADLSEFVERPTDIKRLIDYMLASASDAAKIDPQKIGFFGFSRGGYTGIVLAGGNPDFLNGDVPCPSPDLPVCQQIRRKQVPTEPLMHDARIKAYVLADPLNEFPSPASVKDVKAPIQLWASQYGGDGVLPRTVPALADALPAKPEFHVVPGSAHFAFLAPCSEQLKTIAPTVCVDGNGFDRVAFHERLNKKVVAFFKANVR